MTRARLRGRATPLPFRMPSQEPYGVEARPQVLITCVRARTDVCVCDFCCLLRNSGKKQREQLSAGKRATTMSQSLNISFMNSLLHLIRTHTFLDWLWDLVPTIKVRKGNSICLQNDQNTCSEGGAEWKK